MKAKKSFGQHFLKSDQLSEQIVDQISENSIGLNVMEIGPGRGALTKHLLKRPYHLKVVEADLDLAEGLPHIMPIEKAQIIAADVLKLPWEQVFNGEPFVLIGNFPYNISSQIVFRMVKYHDLIPEMVGMFQKEMADRIIAPPGSKTYGVISVLTQVFYTGEVIFNLDQKAFSPPPKVKSAVIKLRRLEQAAIQSEYGLFRNVVKQAFSQRRKMLRNTMKTFIKGDEILADAFFDKRPEQLTITEFDELTKLIAERIQK